MTGFLKNSFLFLFTLISLFLFTEAVLRLSGAPVRMPYWEKSAQDDNQYFLRPGQWYMEKWPLNRRKCSVTINSMGFRDREIEHPYGLRILVLGDEPTFGRGVELEQTYAQNLENSLKGYFGRDDIEVINAGMPLSSVVQQRLLLEKAFAKIFPAIVILQVSVNDISDIGSDKYSYFFKEAAVPVPRLLRNTAVYTQFVKCKLEILSFIKKKDLTVLREPLDAPAGFYDLNMSESVKAQWKNYGSELEKICTFAGEKRIGLALFFVPSEYQVNNEAVSALPQEMLAEFARVHNIVFIDSLEFFRERKNKYQKDDFYHGAGLLKPSAHYDLAQMLFDELLPVLRR